MLIFDRYLFKKIVIATLIGVISMSFLALSGQVLKETQHIFSRDMQGFGLLFEFLLHTFPYILSYMLPWAFLTAALLAVNTLSANNEIVSIRMAGLSYGRIALPIILLGIVCSSFLYYSSGTLTPTSRLKINEMLGSTGADSDGLQLTPRLLNNMLGTDDFLINTESIEGEVIKNLHLYKIAKATGEPETYIYAKEALLDFSTAYKVSITLNNVYMETYKGDEPPETMYSDVISPLVLPINKRKPSNRVKYKTNSEIIQALNGTFENVNKKENKLDYFTELVSRISISMSCFSFSLLALPLGLQNSRRANNNGFVWGIVTAALFFGILLGVEGVGETQLVRGIALLSPNILALLVGLYLFRRIRFTA